MIRFTLALVSLMDVKEAFTQEKRRVLLDMMECFVDHVVKVTQIYIFQSIIIIQSCVAVLLDMLSMKGYHSSSRKCRKCSRIFLPVMILTIYFLVVVGKSSDCHTPIFPNHLKYFFFM